MQESSGKHSQGPMDSFAKLPEAKPKPQSTMKDVYSSKEREEFIGRSNTEELETMLEEGHARQGTLVILDDQLINNEEVLGK